MTMALHFAALLVFVVGVAHSAFGERYILRPLFRQNNLPVLFGSTGFTRHTLRWAWHVSTIAWWGFASVLFQLADNEIAVPGVAWIIGATFTATAVATVIISRGRHLAWLVFLAIGVIALVASYQ